MTVRMIRRHKLKSNVLWVNGFCVRGHLLSLPIVSLVNMQKLQARPMLHIIFPMQHRK